MPGRKSRLTNLKNYVTVLKKNDAFKTYYMYLPAKTHTKSHYNHHNKYCVIQ